jgi:predicted ATP-grasp superfamily ATP-dependent carboligase
MNGAWGRTRTRPAIVLGASYCGLAFVRSLGRRGVPVFAFDSRPFEVGMHSRHARAVVLPDPSCHPQRWIEFMTALGPLLDCRPVIFVAGDPHLDLLSAGRESLARYYDFAIPPRAALELLQDKRSQYQWLERGGVDLPGTRMPTSEAEAVHAAGSIGFPCLAKPAVSHRWNRRFVEKAIVIGAPGQAAEAYRAMDASGCGCVIQEIVEGGDDHFFGALCCFSRGGEPLAAMTKKKLRQYPERFGNGSVQVSVELPELAARSFAILRRLGCAGFGTIEYKLDPADGKMKLIEINPRLVSGLQLAVDSGCDLPWISYCDLAGLPQEESAVQGFGVLFMNEAWELRRVMKRRSLREWIGYGATLARARSFASLSLTDPGPACSLVRRALTQGFAV